MAFIFNGETPEHIFYEDREIHQLYYNDELVFETIPITPDSYIYYSFDPITGFYTESDGRRYVNDEGNTLMVGASGQFNGVSYSGRYLIMNDTQSLTIPVIDYVLYYDAIAHEHVQEQHTGVDKVFTNQSVGHIVTLVNGASFTPDDFVLLDADPELLTRLALGHTDTGLSLTPSDLVGYYPVTEHYYATCYDMIAGSNIDISNYEESIRVKGFPFGMQMLRFRINDIGVPIHFINEYNQIHFSGWGDAVDTGVIVDGTAHDFSMMMAFTYNDTDTIVRTIASTAGVDVTDNRLVLRVTNDNRIEVVIGKNVFDATSFLDPNEDVHAFLAVYDQVAGTLQGAVDGSAFQDFGAITFDGQTLSSVYFGIDNGMTNFHRGSIGAGIMTARQVTNDEWIDFWQNVRFCYKPGFERIANANFDCGLKYWSDNFPEYNGEKVDNNDGTVTLTAIENFASLEPESHNLPYGTYELTMEITEITGTAKFSIQNTGMLWHNVIEGVTAAGTYTGTYTGDVGRMNIGADDDVNAVITFSSISMVQVVADTPPYATDVVISDNSVVGETINGTYTYNDDDGDVENGTTFQWYRTDDAGATQEPISGATLQDYVIDATDEDWQIAFGVTVANDNGTGTEVLSAWSNVVTAPSGGYCPEYQAVYDAMTTKPSEAIATAQNTMVADLVDAGLWSKFVYFYNFINEVNTDGECYINWITPGTYNAVEEGDGELIFIPLGGIQGDLVNELNTGYAPAVVGDIPPDSASIGLFDLSTEVVYNQTYELGFQTYYSTYIQLSYSDGLAYFCMTANTDVGYTMPVENPPTMSMWTMTRSGDIVSTYKNEELLDSSIYSVADWEPDVNMYIFGAYSLAKTDRILGFSFIGHHMTEAEVAILFDVLNTYRITVTP